MLDLTDYNNPTVFPAFAMLESNFDYFLTQLSNDTEIPKDKKVECLNILCKIPITDPIAFSRECDLAVFHKNKLLGTCCNHMINLNPFVRINDLDAFINWISQLTGINVVNARIKINEITYATTDILKTKLLTSFLNNKVVSKAYDASNCFNYFGIDEWVAKDVPKLKDALISSAKGIQWSFPMPSADIFKDPLEIQNLACRAGVLNPRKKIIFQHILSPLYKIKKPTVFDAGFYSQFSPGGKTKPLLSCNHLTGFDEFVHRPNHFHNLQHRFYEIF